ncbi:hypothetical protein FRB94_006117 [Tulasnella sp. JGI-2019a]|nr:hypothetical protein FRB93_000986 [Tulasnella sp. JGI-2019a]KAG8999559.1 hypothetical protein FRB94_006117 [Tulasnella sp. JGI-2019a]KAG9034392.1 hypothetical protein FRB95_013300 [Tulasnella sp. JGI-2019a]
MIGVVVSDSKGLQRKPEPSLNAPLHAANQALAALALLTVITRISPSLDARYSPPLFITQNVDGLSKRALESLPPDAKAAGEKNLLQMHGNIFVTQCTSCKREQLNFDVPLCTAPSQHGMTTSSIFPTLGW